MITEYSHLVKGDKGFSKYTRKAKRQADEGMLMFLHRKLLSLFLTLSVMTALFAVTVCL